jgi:hypothetical protein
MSDETQVETTEVETPPEAEPPVEEQEPAAPVPADVRDPAKKIASLTEANKRLAEKLAKETSERKQLAAEIQRERAVRLLTDRGVDSEIASHLADAVLGAEDGAAKADALAAKLVTRGVAIPTPTDKITHTKPGDARKSFLAKLRTLG